MPSTYYGAQFRQIPGLTWLPWVGRHFHVHGSGVRLLVVGESHYTNDRNPETVTDSVRRVVSYPTYTREVVQECPIALSWRNRTLQNIPRVLIGGDATNRAQLWGDIAFYNFIQRPMAYARKERPVWNDWVAAWPVFVDIARVLRPSHCVFIGVQASHSLPYAMGQMGILFEPVKREPKVGSSFPRTTNVTVDGHVVSISFIKHAGKCFSWTSWHSFLRGKCGDIVQLLQRGQQP